jgi:hypothetical protein
MHLLTTAKKGPERGQPGAEVEFRIRVPEKCLMEGHQWVERQD